MKERTYQDLVSPPEAVPADDALAMIWTNVWGRPLTPKDLDYMGKVASLLKNLQTLPEFHDFTEQQVVLGALLFTRSMTRNYAGIIRALLPLGTFKAPNNAA